jgi:hypothetical protein
VKRLRPRRACRAGDRSGLDRRPRERRTLLVLREAFDAQDLGGAAELRLDGVHAEAELGRDLLVGGRAAVCVLGERPAERDKDASLRRREAGGGGGAVLGFQRRLVGPVPRVMELEQHVAAADHVPVLEPAAPDHVDVVHERPVA